MSDLTTRPATHDDYEAVAAFTRETWSDRGASDYIPRVYHDWIDGDGATQRTLLAEVDGTVVGIAQCVLLSDYEAWGQGVRVHPEYRGQGVSTTITRALYRWARDRGARVMRNMVFSWNVPALGQSRAVGYDPVTAFRWATPEPDADASPALPVGGDPDAAYAYWTGSEARDHLRGLALDREESWAVSELTRAALRRAAEEERVFAVDDGGTAAMAFRVRDYERTVDGDGEGADGDATTERRAEYGVGAWESVEAARALFDAVAADAAALGADRTRVLIPETPRHVTDAAYVRAGLSEEPDFVLAADLTDERVVEGEE